MRTALVLLLLLALAAVPGSVIPQEGVDSLATSRWKDAHPDLTPVYERLGLFSVYDSVWFSAIYLLLVLSLVGCIVPRTYHYARALRTPPPRTPRHLSRLPDHATYPTDDGVDVVLERAREVLGRRHRLRADDGDDSVGGERGRLREVGNLLFHLSVLVVLAGFAVGGLFGYQGGVVVVRGDTFVNTSTQYDDFDPGSLFRAEDLDPFTFTVDDFDLEWNVQEDSVQGQDFSAPLSYGEGTGPRDESYDLRVNHPLTIGGTDIFLLGHGYAPVITVRDAAGDVVSSGPEVFLPQDSSFVSFGVVKAQSARPQIGLEGLFFPTDVEGDGAPASVFPDDLDPLVSMTVWTGDLGYDTGAPQSVYALDTTNATQVTRADGQPFRVDLRPGQRVQLPDGLGSVEFEGVEPWVRLQVSQTPGKRIALLGVVLALIGLLGSLFVRPRRVWVRARRDGAGTMVEVAVLDRSGNGEAAEVLERIVAQLRGDPADPRDAEESG
jgi:cytochrome c biogenesis protein